MVYLLIAKEDSVKEQTSRKDNPIVELLFEYKDVFPGDLPLGLPPIRGIEHQIDLPEPHCPIRLPISVIQRKPRNYRSKLMKL